MEYRCNRTFLNLALDGVQYYHECSNDNDPGVCLIYNYICPTLCLVQNSTSVTFMLEHKDKNTLAIAQNDLYRVINFRSAVTLTLPT